jgi:DNA repair protein RadD
VLARPTLSPGLYSQMTGRGFRNAPGKTDCLVLDYGSNIQRHGPVDAITIKEKNGEKGEAPIRECPKCHLILAINVSRCALYGYVFPMPEPEPKESKLDQQASQEGILSGQKTETVYEVLEVSYGKHYKKNGTPDDPPTLRIEYRVGFNAYVKKWVCPEHQGWAWENRFLPWWNERCGIKPPTTVDEALHYAKSGYLAVPQRITVIKTSGQRFEEIIEHDFTEKPTPPDTSYEPPRICGDCHLFFHGDCPYEIGLFGDENACEHFLEPSTNNDNDEVPF